MLKSRITRIALNLSLTVLVALQPIALASFGSCEIGKQTGKSCGCLDSARSHESIATPCCCTSSDSQTRSCCDVRTRSATPASNTKRSCCLAGNSPDGNSPAVNSPAVNQAAGSESASGATTSTLNGLIFKRSCRCGQVTPPMGGQSNQRVSIDVGERFAFCDNETTSTGGRGFLLGDHSQVAGSFLHTSRSLASLICVWRL